ncbi:hypothetical protein FAM09_02540 [Niastella caeni]|uniref:Uncharacterized protein n=1 Tax=Niastella caeni TaxID=2569763 RepID=A0A4S8I3V3_9BACT|nr:hypothetical protein [Niastella caeni]THU41012.1 hypothetical protein FAM09_02540 [Niastella caeni]
MYKIIISLLLIITGFSAFPQSVAVPTLINMLHWTPNHIDTTLKKDGYLLMEKDIDSTSSLYQYSWFDKQDDGNAVVRSFVLMEAKVRNLSSRLITYRTYNKEEYQQIAGWLLENNYHATARYDFKEAKHTIYSNGTVTIRVKVITTRLKDGRKYIAYELELGK